MKNANIKAILFDFGNVLGYFDHMKACKEILKHSGKRMSPEELQKELFNENGLARAFELGKLTKNEFFVCMQTTYKLTSALGIESFSSLWGDIFTEVPGVREVLKNIYPDVLLGILSNTDPIHWEHIRQMEVVREVFPDDTYVTTSFREKLRKPAPFIYRVTELKFRCPKEHILFIDDIEENVRAAEAFGFHAWQFDARTMNPIELEAIFKVYGIT